MLDDDFAVRLASAPQAEAAVSELFSAAREASESRVFLAAIDLETQVHDDKKFLVCEMRRHWMIQQFAEYYSRVLPSIETVDPDDVNVSVRLQMLAYSQFWECSGIQRLITHLVKISLGEPYDARLLLDTPTSTFDVFESVKKKCCALGLDLADFLEAVYSNQIRNAFAHSDFWMVLDYITFQNHKHSKSDHVASLHFATWERLFKVTTEFVSALFEARRELEADLISRMPYRVDLPEFTGPFNLSKDERGFSSAKPTR